MNKSNSSTNLRRILGRVAPHEFVGRAYQLAQVVVHGTAVKDRRGMLLLMEPSAGVSELLRQAYDQVFNQRSNVIPIYFAFSRNDPTAVSSAIEFLNTFLQQYVAYRRDEPQLCRAALTLPELVALTPAMDLVWIEPLVDSYNRLRFSNDDKALVRFCLAAPQRMPARLGRPFVMLDGAELAEHINGAVHLGTEVLRIFARARFSFVLAGLRRQLLEAAHNAKSDFQKIDLLRLEKLEVDQSRLLVERVAERHQIVVGEEVRDLIVQQFSGSPFFLTNFLQAARESSIDLNSYLDCERLYVDEILGGHVHRHFAELLEEIAPEVNSRQKLIRLLWEAQTGDSQTASFENWRKRLDLSPDDLENVLHRLHVREFINWNGATVEVDRALQPWSDYLKIRYRLDVLNEPRALVVANMLTESLKRALQLMAEHYKDKWKLRLRELISRFDCQRVPAVLFSYSDYREKYLAASDDELKISVAAETDLMRLPQTVNVASCQAFSADMRQVCEEDRCVVAHVFEDATYMDEQEVVWLATQIESKLEVKSELAELWCQRLETMASLLGFKKYRIWLISDEGFSDEAGRHLKDRGVLASNRRQVQVIATLIGQMRPNQVDHPPGVDEFLVVVPMGEDNELIAANTVEQIARRMTFKPEAINQIKTAIVEACINATEHSFSPDQKIYQRFRVENDRLVITISSRGLVPAGISSKGVPDSPEIAQNAEERRGWGLKLIRTLMDEVEFERADEGTRLRMTKYLHNNSF